MIGLRRLSYDENAEVLRAARAGRLAQAPADEYRQAMTTAEHELGLR